MRYNEFNRKQEGNTMSDEFGSDYITIVDDDGQEFELEVIESMDYNGKTYMSFLPADMKEDDPDYGFILLRVVEDEDGNDVFESIDDEDELQDVYERFMVLLYDDEDEEEDE
jgi:hypothetical protein